MKKLITALSIIAICTTVCSAQNWETPVHRPLVEEYTAFWCSWCPRGHIAMEMINEQYADEQVTISYHMQDDLAVTNSFPVRVQSAPNATIDRGTLMDPYYGFTERTDFAIADELDKAMAQETVAAIEVSGYIDGNRLIATADVCFIEDFNNARYQIGYVLTCNNLMNPKWRQQNEYPYYRDRGFFEGTPLEPLTQMSVAIRDFVYNYVAVDVSGMNGVAGSLPSVISAGESYSHSYSFNIDNNSLIEDPENLVVVAFVVDRSSGRVINSNKYSFAPRETTGVGSVSEPETVKTEYYNLSGVRVANPSGGLYIRKETLGDGSVKCRKELILKK